MNEMEERAIIQANKLGARGFRVIGIIEPAATEPDYKFIIDSPEQSAIDRAWYEE